MSLNEETNEPASNHITITNLSDLHTPNWWHSYSRELTDEGQTALAELILMTDKLQYIDGRSQQERLLQLILFACDNLVYNNNITFANKILSEIRCTVNEHQRKKETKTYSILRFFKSSRSQRIYTMLGLLLFLIGIIILSLFVDISSAAEVASIPKNIFTTAILFGTLGSCVSIMLRFDEHETIHSSADLFLLGFFKPIVGAIFALVLFAVYKAGVLSLFNVETGDTETYFLIVLFFLAGFSERFVGDVLSKIEKQESGQ